MTRLAVAALAIAVCGWPLSAAPDAEPQLVQREVYLMGTRALLATYAASREEGVTALEKALDVLEHTEAELSTWRPDSEVSRLHQMPAGEPWRAGPTLCRLFAEVYDWQQATTAAFDPAIGALAAVWDIHGGGRIPSDEALAEARSRSGLRLLEFDREACTLVRRGDVTLDVGAFGKGEALDRAARALSGRTWLIDLGGQVAAAASDGNAAPWTIDIAHPLDRQRAVMQLELRSGSVSTSAGSERDLYLGSDRVGHVLDPRTGRPAPFNGSVVVWHSQGLAADILSTALYVMGPAEGLPWAETRGIAAAYLIAGRELQVASTTAFRRLSPRPRTARD